jgi:hypothetical protein
VRGVFSPGRVAAACALLALLLGLTLYRGRYDPGGPGQVWRRGMLGGEQVRLLPGGRYQLERWRSLGSDETLEAGNWNQLGQVISLVPGQGGPPRVMRVLVRGEARFLYEPAPGGAIPPQDTLYQRVD